MSKWLLFWFFLCSGYPTAACEIGAGAAVPAAVLDHQILVNAAVNGRPVLMLLDTGAARTVLTERAVARLGLPRSEWASMTLRGVGGIDRQRVAIMRDFSLGGLPLRRKTLAAEMSVPVTALDWTVANGTTLAGLLGGDYLSAFDLDLDMPHHTLSVHRVSDCVGRFIPWSGTYDILPAVRPNLDLLLLPVTISGQALVAELDTGAQWSVMTTVGRAKLGLTEAANTADPSVSLHGLGPNVVAMRRHVFAEVKIGSEVLRDMPLLMGQVSSLHSVDLLLGADWLERHHVWISYATMQVFVATAAEAR